MRSWSAPGLDWLGEHRNLPRRHVAVLGIAAVVGFVLDLPPDPSAHPGAMSLALVLAALLVATVVGVPWGAVPQVTLALPALLYLAALLCLRVTDPGAAGFAIIMLLPLMWSALTGTRRTLITVVVAGASVMLLAAALPAGAIPGIEWQRIIAFLAVGPVVGYLAQTLVSAQREQARHLTRLQASSDAVIEAVSEGLLVLDSNQRVIKANSAACRICSLDRDQMLHRPVSHLFADVRPLGETSANAVPDYGIQGGEFLVTLADHTDIPLEVTVSALDDQDGEGSVVVAYRDISARVRARLLNRATLLVSAALAECSGYADALPRIAAGLGETLNARLIVLWSLGENSAVTLDHYWEDPDNPSPHFGALCREATTAQGGLATATSGRVHWADDPRDLDPQLYPRADAAIADRVGTTVTMPLGDAADPVGIMEITFADVVSPDELSQDYLLGLAVRIGEAARREQLQADATRHKDEFFALVSHELRTPLTSISGYLELLAEELEEDPGARKFLDIIGRNTDRLRRLVEDLLFVARVDAGQLTLRSARVDLVDVARGAVEVSRPAADGKGVTLFACAGGETPVWGDAGRLGQVLDNLLSNAVKFTSEGGRIHVEIARRRDGDERRVVIDVIDSGMGIGPADLERLFGRFVRTAEAEAANIPGVGLGLVISRAIVLAHGGRINVFSTLGEGTTFRVELPLLVDEALPEPEPVGVLETSGASA